MPTVHRVPTRLGPYRLLDSLGEGAMGEVFLAEEDGEEHRIALKVLHPHLLRRPHFFERFEREADAGEAVRHPNVISTLDAGFHVVDGDTWCVLAMEYFEGRTLRDVLRDLGAVPEPLLRELATRIAEGLAAIHEAGVVHRDLKPENVLVSLDHQVRIMDLGVARLLEDDLDLTGEGQFIGSLPYAAPEQLQGRPVGPASDLYALGVLLHELASGTNPFRRDGFAAVLRAHTMERPTRLAELDPDLSPFLSELVADLLAKDETDRPPSAAHVARVLSEGEASQWWQERETALRQRARRIPRVPVRRETKLYGRDEDLARLEGAWGRAREGEGNTVLLEGEAGIGKSRLVDAFLSSQDLEDAHVLYGACTADAGGRRGIRDALLAHFGSQDLSDALRPYLTETPGLVDPLAAWLTGDQPLGEETSLQGDVLHAVLVHLMRGLARERPLLWVIEDLHLADGDVRRRVLSLARAAEGHPVLLLLTARPELPAEAMAHFTRLENFGRARLGRLGARQVIELLQDAFHSERLADKLGSRIALKSDGVPFFVFEMIRGLKERQFITELPDGSWVESEEIDEIEVPDTVRDLIEARLRGMSDEQRNVLDVGAVQGFEFDPDLVARVLRRPRIEVLQALAAVERRSGVLRAHGRGVRFDHHHIQEVLYEALMPTLREEYHAMLARERAAREGVEPARADKVSGETALFLASHGLQGHEPAEGVPYLERALAHLAALYRHEEAIRLARRALDAPGLLQGRVRMRVSLLVAKPMRFLGRHEEATAVVQEAQALATEARDLVSLSEAQRALSVLANSLRRYEEAKAHGERSLALALETGDRSLEAAAVLAVGNSLANLGRNEEAKAYYDRCLALARGIGYRRAVAAATGNLGLVLQHLGHLEEARAHREEYVTISREIGDRQGEAIGTMNLGSVLKDLGRCEEAKELHERGLALARGIGDRWLEVDAVGCLGSTLHALGCSEEAMVHHERHLALTREIGDQGREAMATHNLGVVLMSLGRSQEAKAYFDRSLALAREVGDRPREVDAVAGLGSVLGDLGRNEEARAHFERVLALVREIGDRRREIRATGNLGVRLRYLGRCEEAKELHERSLALAREVGARRAEAAAMIELGNVLHDLGRGEEATAVLERGLALAREVEDRRAEAWATGHLGAVFHTLGCIERANAHYERYLALAREIRDRRAEGNAIARLGALAHDAGDAEAALDHATTAIALHREFSHGNDVVDALIFRAEIHSSFGRSDETRASLEEAMNLLGNQQRKHKLARTLALFASLPDGDAEVAEAALEEAGDAGNRLETRYYLWKATGKHEHLAEAKRLLDYRVEHAPEEYRESMLKSVRLNREIMEAWAEHGEAAVGEGDAD